MHTDQSVSVIRPGTGSASSSNTLNVPGARRERRATLFRFLPQLVSLILLLAGIAQTQPRYSNLLRPVNGTPSIIFVSDTQSPLWFERFRLRSDHNEAATREILKRIAEDTTCTAVFHLGDITALGSFSSYWRTFDRESEAIRDARLPIFPAFGNHEYMPSAGPGRRNFFVRFPFLHDSWYVQRIGSTAVVILNSNFDRLTADETNHQQHWYEQTLDDLDRDSTITLIVVGCHHPPYTNSTIVEPSGEVQRRFVPPFLKSGKAKLFLSGHAHALERFRIGGKDFLVLGGGGGLLHPLLRGKDRRWEDMIDHAGPRSFFHFVRLFPSIDSLTVQVMALQADRRGVSVAYQFTIGHP